MRSIVAYISEATPYSPTNNTHPPVSYNTRPTVPPIHSTGYEPGVNSDLLYIYSIHRIPSFTEFLLCQSICLYLQLHEQAHATITLPLSQTCTTITKSLELVGFNNSMMQRCHDTTNATNAMRICHDTTNATNAMRICHDTTNVASATTRLNECDAR